MINSPKDAEIEKTQKKKIAEMLERAQVKTIDN
jgi:hypothetical protein